MAKCRMRFRKEEQAAYISHLDLLRTFQRAFLRAGYVIRHSQGFHPHPLISIVLPLPVGESSLCELMDFETDGETDRDALCQALRRAVPLGISVEECYEAVRPARELAFIEAEVTFYYDGGVPENAEAELLSLFTGKTLLIEKRTKRKENAEVDIRPMIESVSAETGEKTITFRVTVQAQNPGLNPALLGRAAERYCPHLSPDHTEVVRLHLLDGEKCEFR